MTKVFVFIQTAWNYVLLEYCLNILCLSLLATPALGVVGGKPLNKRQQKVFSPFVSIGDQRVVSGGVHIGEGLILTAEHVVNPIFQGVPVVLRDIEGNELGTFKMDRGQQILVAPMARDEIIVQVPDLAIMIPPPELRTTLRKLPVADLAPWPKRLLPTDEVILVGVGAENFDPVGSAFLRSAHLGIFHWDPRAQSNDEYVLSMPYKPGQNSSGASGDSGSALWLKRGSKYQAVGIASAIRVPDEQGKNGETHFARLDSKPVLEWLTHATRQFGAEGCLAIFKKTAK